jgi:hypothetical protein
MIKQSHLKELFDYNPITGLFTRLKSVSSNTKLGDIAGYPHHTGYAYITIDGKMWQVHRLAWIYVYGELPKYIDHINRDKKDNRICNLRRSTYIQNTHNVSRRVSNTSGFKGVSFIKRTGRWVARISLNSKNIHLGSFDTPHEAHAAYCKKGKELRGEFFCAG